MLMYLFFFFQAEDGIRDKLVTGVQTCALPISPPQVWPFCWWVGIAVDHYSRRVMGYAVYCRGGAADRGHEGEDDTIGNLTSLSQTGESSDAPASFSDYYKEPFT